MMSAETAVPWLETQDCRRTMDVAEDSTIVTKNAEHVCRPIVIVHCHKCTARMIINLCLQTSTWRQVSQVCRQDLGYWFCLPMPQTCHAAYKSNLDGLAAICAV